MPKSDAGSAKIRLGLRRAITTSAGMWGILRPIGQIPAAGKSKGVAAAILRALAAGDFELALELLGGIAGKAGVSTISATVSYAIQKNPLSSFRCDQAAQMIQKTVTAIGAKSDRLTIVAHRGVYLRYQGTLFSTVGNNFAVLRDGRVHDGIAGVGGMPLKEYMRLWCTRIAPASFTDSAGNVIQ